MDSIEGSGLIPITLGAVVADEVTGRPSMVVGVRVNPATNVVVPVTAEATSSSRQQRRAPLGATATLEEEIAARRGHWRRCRQREDDLLAADHRLFECLLLGDSAESGMDGVLSTVQEVCGAVQFVSQSTKCIYGTRHFSAFDEFSSRCESMSSPMPTSTECDDF